MKQMLILVEGQTEEAFVRDVLNPHLAGMGRYATPVILTTKRLSSGGKFRGGVRSWEHTQREIRTLLRARHVTVSTMFDLYGLPAAWPGRIGVSRPDDIGVEKLEDGMAQAIGDRRFVPYLMKHEFEALLYADPVTCGRHAGSSTVAGAMARVVRACGEPELINHRPATAPSKRLQEIWPSFAKVSDGPAITEAIGIPRLCKLCPHFAAWVTKLETCGGRGKEKL